MNLDNHLASNAFHSNLSRIHKCRCCRSRSVRSAGHKTRGHNGVPTNRDRKGISDRRSCRERRPHHIIFQSSLYQCIPLCTGSDHQHNDRFRHKGGRHILGMLVHTLFLSNRHDICIRLQCKYRYRDKELDRHFVHIQNQKIQKSSDNVQQCSHPANDNFWGIASNQKMNLDIHMCNKKRTILSRLRKETSIRNLA